MASNIDKRTPVKNKDLIECFRWLDEGQTLVRGSKTSEDILRRSWKVNMRKKWHQGGSKHMYFFGRK
jgi:hypothetical protein